MLKKKSGLALIFIACLARIPIAASETEFAIIADAGKTNTNSTRVRESIVKAGVTRLVLPGDNLYNGSYSSVWDSWKNLGMTFDIVALGNHHGGYRQEMAYFSMPGEYYSMVIANTRFIVLNSDNDETASEQVAWLDKELGEAKEPMIFLVYHHPSYTISSFHHWQEKANFQRAIRPIIWEHRSKITALLLGHDHLATLVNFGDLPVIVSGAIHELRSDKPVDYTIDGVRIKTAWYFDLQPYWAHLSLRESSAEAVVEFIRAKDDKVACTAIIHTGGPASLQKNCF